MAAKRRLSYENRVKIAVLREEGYSLGVIASKVKCSRSCVSKTLARLKETESLKDRKRSGRPRISSSREDRALARISLHDRRLTSSHLKREWQETSGVQCSARTVRRRLDEVGLHGRVARRKPLLTDRHRRVRLEWAKEREHWSVSDWQLVIWSDESKFNLIGNDGRVFVRRRTGEELLPECIQPMVKFGGGNVMVWGCISCNGVGPLVKVEGRMNSKDYIRILSGKLLPYIRSLGSNFVFMDDNAPCHRAHAVTRWMSAKNVKKMEIWPPQSPDLNPIEQVWDLVGSKLDSHKPKNLAELEKNIMEEWSKIPPTYIHTLISSMPRRVAAVIAAKGGHTKY